MRMIAVIVAFLATASVARGTLVTASIPGGFENVAAGNADAKAAIDAGGVVVRESKPKKGLAPATLGASPMPRLPIDPAIGKFCALASQDTATNAKATLEHAEVVTIASSKACRADISFPGAKYRAQSFTWLLVPKDQLAVQIVCTYATGDTSVEAACQKFAESVKPAR